MAGTDVSGINGIQENGTAVSGFPELPVLDSPESQYSGTGNNGINARIWWYYPAGTAGTAPPEQRYSKLRNGGLIWAGILNEVSAIHTDLILISKKNTGMVLK